MKKDELVKRTRARYNKMKPYLNEKSRRVWGAMEIDLLGKGGATIVSKATGLDYKTLKKGKNDLSKEDQLERKNRIRKKGGGRKKEIEKDPLLRRDLDALIDPETRGDPENPLRWTSKNTRKLSSELKKKNHQASTTTVSRILKKDGYSLQANRKTNEGGKHPDRNKQFHYINNKSKQFIDASQPVISVDGKKKENIGNFKQSGKEYYKKGEAPDVNVYDFIDKAKGKVTPYGIYDLSKNNGWVSVGVSKDTAQFAVNSIKTWWFEMGKETYLNAKHLLITADCGGSNSNRTRLWKSELQNFSNETGLTIHVSHFPPGTSKWNKIEHRMFSFISKNWRGRPLLDQATVLNLISNTTTTKGLTIKAVMDEKNYDKGLKISDKDFQIININKFTFHGEWNYKVSPSK